MSVETLSQFPLFDNLPEREIWALAESSQVCRFQAGEVLFTEGSSTDYFYLILDGEVEIIKSLGTADERLLAMSQKNAILGEMSKFSQNGTHTASARTYTPCKMLKVSFDQFDAVLNRHPKMAYDLLRLYSRRLENSESATIRDLREKNRQLTQAYNDLKIAQAAMIEKEKLDQEMRLASKIQRNILPKELPHYPGLGFGALMIPAKQVGGDFYDFIPLDDHKVGIVVGDVCDKGMPAALFMALTYSSLRMEALRNDDPGTILRAVNRHLLQIDCSDMFVTLLYGVFNCESREFFYARAGHPKPLLLDGRIQSMDVPYDFGQAVGIFDPVDIDEERLVVPEGGTLLIYSDGLSETIDDQIDTPELPQLCSSIMDGKDLSAQALCDQLWRTVGGSDAESLIKDDFTVVALRCEFMDGGDNRGY